MRKILWGTGIVIVLLLLVYAYQAWENNRSVKMPDQAQIQHTLEKAIQWLDQNRDNVPAASNPPLWYMVQQAAEITGDQRLTSLFAAYMQRFLKNRANNVWRPLFNPDTRVSVSFEAIDHLRAYNWHLIYAINCNKELGDIPEIAIQNDPAFCDQQPMTPTCVTHQLMSIRLLQRSGCGDAAQLDETVQALQQRIRRQLTLDPRVVDVYMQRVLMLVESGASELVKPVWIQNLIDAQQADGGWSVFEPLVPLFGGQYIGYGPRFFSVKQPRSGFHTTIQGVLLFSLLSGQ